MRFSDGLWGGTGIEYGISTLYEVISCVAVDVFAIISGYVGMSEIPYKKRIAKLLEIWLQVTSYSLVFSFVIIAVGKEPLNIDSVARIFTPVTSGLYWYFTSYFWVVIISPFLIAVVSYIVTIEKYKQIMKCLLCMCLYFAITYNLSQDTANLHNGYSVLWLSILYIVGGAIKKTNYIFMDSTRKTKLLLLASVLFTYISKNVIYNSVGSEEMSETFLLYTSPTIVLYAICSVMNFSRLELDDKLCKWIAWASPATFGVFLIHANKYLWNGVLVELIQKIIGASWWELVIAIPVYAIAIFVVCLLIDEIRYFIFNKMRIKNLCNNMIDWTLKLLIYKK